MLAEFGVYIHYPWCRSRCSYCDFPIALGSPDAAYVDRVERELEERQQGFRDHELVSIYVGGGTPSLWDPGDISRVVRAVTGAFGGASLREVTLEANPSDCTAARLDEWVASGVTRLSLGVQSSSQAALVRLGRDHSMGDGLAAAKRCVAHPGLALSADVILGADHIGSHRDTVRQLVEVGVPHLSVYELTIESGTALFGQVRRGEFQPLEDEELADQYEDNHRFLTAAGYEHYEVSSFAKDGARAVHNSLYWSGAPYLGLGNGAVSFEWTEAGGRRWKNPVSVTRYLGGGAPELLEDLSPREIDRDRIWLGLRTSDGVPERAFRGREASLRWLLRSGAVRKGGGRIQPTLKGFLTANQVMSRVLAAEDGGSG